MHSTDKQADSGDPNIRTSPALETRSDELRVEYRAVRSTKTRKSGVFTLQRFRVPFNRPRVEVLGPPLGSFPN